MLGPLHCCSLLYCFFLFVDLINMLDCVTLAWWHTICKDDSHTLQWKLKLEEFMVPNHTLFSLNKHLCLVETWQSLINTVLPTIHPFYNPLNLTKVVGVLEPITAVFGRKADDTPDWSPPNHRAHQQPFTTTDNLVFKYLFVTIGRGSATRGSRTSCGSLAPP